MPDNDNLRPAARSGSTAPSRRRFLGGGAAAAATLTFAGMSTGACGSNHSTTTTEGSGETMTSGTPLEKAVLHGNEVIATPIGDITLIDNYFDADASRRLYDEMDFQRVPAFMHVMGRWNWWAPAPLRALHRRFGISESGAARAYSEDE